VRCVCYSEAVKISKRDLSSFSIRITAKMAPKIVCQTLKLEIVGILSLGESVQLSFY